MFYINMDDGVNLAVYEYNRHCKRTVLMIHGWPLSGKIYEYQLQMLIKNQFHVVTMDLRGFGKSDVPACGYSYDRMAEDIYQVVNALRLSKIILVGYSMGGAIVLRYMNNYSGYGVRKLILLAAAAPCWIQRPGFPYGVTVEYVNGLICLAETDRPQLAQNFSGQLFASCQSEAAILWFRDIALSASGIGTVESLISLRDEDGRSDLRSVHVPTAIIHGSKDEVVPNDLVMIQHREISGSHFYNLDKSGHGIMYDQLQEFNDIFMKEVLTD